MERHLNLIKTDYEQVEKRVFPRFPFSYLIFKGSQAAKVFEVKDISYTGMQLALADGVNSYSAGNTIEGVIHWRGATLKTQGLVKWVTGQRLGVSFQENDDFQRSLKDFLSVDNIVAGMRPLHHENIYLELPWNLKYWLRADGPVEVFVWHHKDGELSKFQFIIFKHFVEWEDGKGTITGDLMTKRDIDTPLMSEDEFVFKMDETIDQTKIDAALAIVEKIPSDYIPEGAIEFMTRKLRG
jgi:hypothetical protein